VSSVTYHFPVRTEISFPETRRHIFAVAPFPRFIFVFGTPMMQLLATDDG